MDKQAFNRGIEKGFKEFESKATDEVLKTLAHIKTTLEHIDYHIDYELEEIIDEIEYLLDKKNKGIEIFKRDERLGTIKKMIKQTYEKIGRNGVSSDGNEMSILINKLNKFLGDLDIPSNYLVIARLKYETNYD